MSNNRGARTVASIEKKDGRGNDPLSREAEQDDSDKTVAPGNKRFLQLYTSKAYCSLRAKLVQPHDAEDNADGRDVSRRGCALVPASSPSLEHEHSRHVLSPRIVEAVTQSAQVVWANCRTGRDGLLGRSDIQVNALIRLLVLGLRSFASDLQHSPLRSSKRP